MSIKQNQSTEKPPDTRWGLIIAWIFVLSLLALVGIQLSKAQQGTVMAGEPAPEFRLTSFDGEEIVLSELAGKVVLINFWASWCVPCRDEALELETAWEYFREGDKVVFLGIDYADTETKALAFLKEFGVTYPNAPDLGTQASQAYRIRGVPETFIIDQNGIIFYFKSGPFETSDQIIEQIELLLNQ